MRLKSGLVLLLLFASISIYAQEIVRAESRVTDVTVYSDRALVTRTAELDIRAGQTVVVFENLPSLSDASSLRVSGKGAFSLRDVKTVRRQLVHDTSIQLNELNDQKKAVESEIAIVQDEIKLAEAELLFLNNMTKRLTGNAGDSEELPLDVSSWAKMFDFYRDNHARIQAAVRDGKAELVLLQEELNRIQREIRALGTGSGVSVLEAELLLEATSAGKAQIELSYLVRGPSWKPDYIIQADSNNANVELYYRAMVRQNTGESWDDVNLTLSTARPQVGGSMPVLPPWYIDTYTPAQATRTMSKAAADAAPTIMLESEELMELGSMLYTSAEALPSGIAVNFLIPGKTRVNSDNKEKTVTVAILKLDAEYSWASVPKLAPSVFFRAKIKNNSEFPLLAGTSHVYVDGTFIADSRLDTVQPDEQFICDLGVDDGVTVSRRLVKKFDETSGLLTKKEKTTWEYEFIIKNNKRIEIEILVNDNIPLSMNEQIVVKLLEPQKEGAGFKKHDDGKLEWVLTLKPGVETKFRLAFSVEYPKGLNITGLD